MSAWRWGWRRRRFCCCCYLCPTFELSQNFEPFQSSTCLLLQSNHVKSNFLPLSLSLSLFLFLHESNIFFSLLTVFCLKVSLSTYLTFCFSLDVTLSISISLTYYLLFHLALSSWKHLWVSFFLSLSLTVFLSITLSLSVFLSITLSLSVSLWKYIYLLFSLAYFFLEASVGFHRSDLLLIPYSLFLSHFLSLWKYVCLFIRVDDSLWEYLSFSQFLFSFSLSAFLSLAVSPCKYLWVSLYLHVYQSISIYWQYFVCASICIYHLISKSE